MTNQTPNQGLGAHRVHEGSEGPGSGYSWRVRIPYAGQWLTSNKPASYRYGAKEWRHSTMVACHNAKLPKGVTPVKLHLICWYETSRAPVRDRLNLAPTIKAIVDGLSPTVISTRNGRRHTRGGYGLLPDDSDRHVHDTTWAIVPGLRPFVDLYITEVTGG